MEGLIVNKVRELIAIKCLHNEEAKKIFKLLLEKYPDASVFWDKEDNEAELITKDFSILITSKINNNLG